MITFDGERYVMTDYLIHKIKYATNQDQISV